MSREHKSVLDLERETRAAEALREALLRLPGMSEGESDTLRDTIEGETSLNEKIGEVLDLLDHAEAMIAGLEKKIEAFELRKTRYESRRDHLRAMLEQAMWVGEIKSLELPDATLTLARRVGGVVIVDEMQIPSEFWRKPDPQVDKAKVAAALKDGNEVPGATLGNGSVSLTVRRG